MTARKLPTRNPDSASKSVGQKFISSRWPLVPNVCSTAIGLGAMYSGTPPTWMIRNQIRIAAAAAASGGSRLLQALRRRIAAAFAVGATVALAVLVASISSSPGANGDGR